MKQKIKTPLLKAESLYPKIEIGKKYIVTKASDNGHIKIGEPLMIECENRNNEDDFLSWTLFGIFRVGKSEYKKLNAQQNTVRHFNEKQELFDFIKGVEVQLDIKSARENIDLLQHEITKIEEDYKLI